MAVVFVRVRIGVFETVIVLLYASRFVVMDSLPEHEFDESGLWGFMLDCHWRSHVSHGTVRCEGGFRCIIMRI